MIIHEREIQISSKSFETFRTTRQRDNSATQRTLTCKNSRNTSATLLLDEYVTHLQNTFQISTRSHLTGNFLNLRQFGRFFFW